VVLIVLGARDEIPRHDFSDPGFDGLKASGIYSQRQVPIGYNSDQLLFAWIRDYWHRANVPIRH
jgi:hypothetical protein